MGGRKASADVRPAPAVSADGRACSPARGAAIAGDAPSSAEPWQAASQQQPAVPHGAVAWPRLWHVPLTEWLAPAAEATGIVTIAASSRGNGVRVPVSALAWIAEASRPSARSAASRITRTAAARFGRTAIACARDGIPLMRIAAFTLPYVA